MLYSLLVIWRFARSLNRVAVCAQVRVYCGGVEPDEDRVRFNNAAGHSAGRLQLAAERGELRSQAHAALLRLGIGPEKLGELVTREAAPEVKGQIRQEGGS